MTRSSPGTDDSPVEERLTYFVQRVLRSQVASLDFHFTWPPEMLGLARCFTDYTWALAIGPASSRVMGICRLPCRPRHDLSRIERAIFAPHAHETEFGVPDDQALEYYLIVDLIAPDSVQVYLSMLVPPDRWYLIEQHGLRHETIHAQLHGICE